MRGLIHPPAVTPLVFHAETMLEISAPANPFTADVFVSSELPDAANRHERMLILRDDGGDEDSILARHRIGANVYAGSKADAALLALHCMGIFRSMPHFDAVAGADAFSGPYLVEDVGSDILTVGEIQLAHYYFVFRVAIRGRKFNPLTSSPLA